MIRCRAKDTIENGIRVMGCTGLAESTFFSGPQDDSQVPHVIFYRPTSELEARREIDKEHKEDRDWLIDHYLKGGSLMREA